MIGLGHYLLAFSVAFLFTLTELLSNEYPMTHRFLGKSACLYAYGAAYGFSSIAFLWCLQYFGLYSCLVTTILGNTWLQAVVIGLITKALLHVSIFRADSIPIGLETFAHIFEPRLLRQIALDEYDARQKYLITIQPIYNNLDDVLHRISDDIPRSVDPKLAESFFYDLDYKLSIEFDGESDETKIKFVMNNYLVMYGVQSFERTFPPQI